MDVLESSIIPRCFALDVLYREDVIKNYGWLIHWTSHFGGGVWIKENSSFMFPGVDQAQIMVHVESSCILIMNDSEIDVLSANRLHETLKGICHKPDWFMRYNSRHCSLQQHRSEA